MNLKWILKTAYKDGLASKRRMTLMVASIVLGIAAVVSILSFGESLSNNITTQSKTLIGADYLITTRQPVTDSLKAIIDSLGGEDAREWSFASMARFPRSNSSRLVQVKAMEGGFPFYGEIETSPANAFKLFREKKGVLVDGTLMLQYHVKPGDSIQIGKLRLKIAGSILRIPGQSGIAATVAPPVYIPLSYIEQTDLILKGSRIDYRFYFKDPTANISRLEKTLAGRLQKQKADLDTHVARAKSIGKNYENVGRFLNVVAFIALLLGCVGVASAVHVYIKEKISTVAILQCIGATRFQTFWIFLFQVAFIGLAGSLAGVLLGTAIQTVFPLLFNDFLPVQADFTISWSSIALGATLGVVMSVLFALPPLLSIWDTSPLNVLRITENERPMFTLPRVLVFALILAFLVLFSYILMKNLLNAVIFIAGVIVVSLLLAGLAYLFMTLIRRFFPSSWSFTARQSLQNLFRPRNQTVILMLSIGIGTFLIGTLYFTQDILLKKVSLQQGAKDPNIIIFDIHTDQKDSLKRVVQGHNLPVLQELPIVTMRFSAIKGTSVSSIVADSTTKVKDWILKREFRVTFRDSLTDTETLEEGKWIGKVKEGTAPIPVSIESGLAEGMQAHVGDQLLFDVQGIEMKTYIASIRKVDWGRLQTNFAIVFPEGVLENAPQFHVVTTRVPNDQVSATLQQSLVKQFPNIAIVDLKQAFITIQDILNKISWVISFMAFFSILTGIVVLTGAVRTSKHQRIKESVLLRTLGAREKQILKINALEYLYLGSIASFSGILLSVIGSFMLAKFVFEIPFTPSAWPALLLFAGITLLTIIIGYTNSLGILKSPPLEVLRKEVS